MTRTAKLLLLLFALVSFAHADEWSKTFTIMGKPSLRIETSDANIRVDTWDQNIIEARVISEHWKIGRGGVRVIDRQSGDSVELEVRLPHEHRICIVCVNIRSYGVNVEIHMPREGRVDLRTGDGSIGLRNFKGDMQLESSDGSQEIDSVDGNLRTHAGDGHIRAAGRFDSVNASTGDGRIEIRALAGSTMASGSWDLHAGDGSVTLELPQNFAANVDLHTGDGHISLDMPITVEGRLAQNNIHGRLNGGGNLLTIHTGDGSIKLAKS